MIGLYVVPPLPDTPSSESHGDAVLGFVKAR